MPNGKSKGSRKKRGGKRKNTNAELPSSAQAASMAIVSRAMRKVRGQTETDTTVCFYDAIFTTSGAGVNNTVLGNSPSSVANWASLAAVWDEYRVLALRLKYVPYKFAGGSTVVVQAPIVVVGDFDTATALTGYSLANQYSSCKEYPGDRPFEYTILMSGSENAQFISTGSPANSFYIKPYTSGNTVSLDIGRVHLMYVIQFRGRGI